MSTCCRKCRRGDGGWDVWNVLNAKADSPAVAIFIASSQTRFSSVSQIGTHICIHHAFIHTPMHPPTHSSTLEHGLEGSSSCVANGDSHRGGRAGAQPWREKFECQHWQHHQRLRYVHFYALKATSLLSLRTRIESVRRISPGFTRGAAEFILFPFLLCSLRISAFQGGSRGFYLCSIFLVAIMHDARLAGRLQKELKMLQDPPPGICVWPVDERNLALLEARKQFHVWLFSISDRFQFQLFPPLRVLVVAPACKIMRAFSFWFSLCRDTGAGWNCVRQGHI